jgi:hypothetical protein
MVGATIYIVLVIMRYATGERVQGSAKECAKALGMAYMTAFNVRNSTVHEYCV